MTDMERVKIWLQCIIEGNIRCESCGYAIDKHGHHSCQQNCASEALDMLKEQEPRVLTADELYLMEHKCVYLERRNSQLYLTEPSIVIGTSKPLALCQYKCILMRENKINDVRYSNDYNKETKSGWRCWSAKPTEERRKEVKWE